MLSPVVLTGQHVRLEPLTMDHLDGLCAIGFEPSLWDYMLSRVATREQMAAFIEGAAGPSQQAFAAVHIASGRVAGCTRYMNYEPAHKRVEIGSTWYGPDFQRTAVNTECKSLLFRHAFETMGMNRVELKTDSRNVRSQTAIKHSNRFMAYPAREPPEPARKAAGVRVIDHQLPSVRQTDGFQPCSQGGGVGQWMPS